MPIRAFFQPVSPYPAAIPEKLITPVTPMVTISSAMHVPSNMAGSAVCFLTPDGKAARMPVQAPVTGSGITTNNIRLIISNRCMSSTIMRHFPQNTVPRQRPNSERTPQGSYQTVIPFPNATRPSDKECGLDRPVTITIYQDLRCRIVQRFRCFMCTRRLKSLFFRVFFTQHYRCSYD